MKIILFIVFICSLAGIFIINSSVPELPDADSTVSALKFGHPKMRMIIKQGIKQVFFYDGDYPTGDSTFTIKGDLLAVNTYSYGGRSGILGTYNYPDFKINRKYVSTSEQLRTYGVPVLFIITLLSFILLLYFLVKDYKKKKALNVSENK
jgi:hypothetical protein